MKYWGHEGESNNGRKTEKKKQIYKTKWEKNKSGGREVRRAEAE